MAKSRAIKTMMDKHGLDKAIYIGDTLKDKTAAQDAGVPFIQARYGYGEKLDTKYYINSLNELMDIVYNVLYEDVSKLHDLKEKYDKLQEKYGAKELDSIYNGGCESNPNICFVFMNPTGKNIASAKTWNGRKSPWLGTKNIWKLFYNVGLLSEDTFNKIQEKKPKDWNYEFCDYVYDEIKDNKLFITNLGKCTQLDARPLPDEVLKQYLDLLFHEIDIIKPKVIITFGNQVSSIILNKKVSVSESRKKFYELDIKGSLYKVYPVYYPVGNGMFNIDKSIEDIKWIIESEKIK